MAEIRNIGPRRGLRQAMVDLTEQDRLVNAETQVFARSRPVIHKTLDVSNASGSFVDWDPFQVEDGYTIWKVAEPSGFRSDPNNVLFVRNKHDQIRFAYENRGSARTEGVSDQFVVFQESGTGNFITHTAEAVTDLGTPFQGIEGLFTDDDHYLYIGRLGSTVEPFEGISIVLQTPGTGYSLFAQYWDGTKWSTGVTPILRLDATNNLIQKGQVLLDVPLAGGDPWTVTTVNSSEGTYVRLGTQASVGVSAQFYSIRPVSGVGDLLLRSPTQVMARNLAWCDFNANLYVTIPNAGLAHREGLDYIRSGSNAGLRRSFFAAFQQHKVQMAVPADFRIPAFQSGSVAFYEWWGSGTAVGGGALHDDLRPIEPMSQGENASSLAIIWQTSVPSIAIRSGDVIRSRTLDVEETP